MGDRHSEALAKLIGMMLPGFFVMGLTASVVNFTLWNRNYFANKVFKLLEFFWHPTGRSRCFTWSSGLLAHSRIISLSNADVGVPLIIPFKSAVFVGMDV